MFFFFLPRLESGLAVASAGGGRRLDSNDGGMPLWAALALWVSCRSRVMLSNRLAAYLVPYALLRSGGLYPLGGEGDPGWEGR